MEGRALSVIRADERADDGHEHRYLNADHPREVAVYFLIGAIESLIDLRLYFTEPMVDLFEPSVHLILQRYEPVVDLLEPSMHLILQPSQCAPQIRPAHGVGVHPRLECGDPLFQRRHVGLSPFRAMTTRWYIVSRSMSGALGQTPKTLGYSGLR